MAARISPRIRVANRWRNQCCVMRPRSRCSALSLATMSGCGWCRGARLGHLLPAQGCTRAALHGLEGGLVLNAIRVFAKGSPARRQEQRPFAIASPAADLKVAAQRLGGPRVQMRGDRLTVLHAAPCRGIWAECDLLPARRQDQVGQQATVQDRGNPRPGAPFGP